MLNPDKIKEYVRSNFKRFGINKRREISRLLYEISKRDNTGIIEIIEGTKDKKYHALKKTLLKKRFPRSFSNNEKIEPYLPELDIDKNNKALIDSTEINPKTVFFDRSSRYSEVLERLKKRFIDTEFTEIGSLKEYIKENPYSLETYNSRRDRFFVIEEKHDFIKRCPCTRSCVSCNYYILNLGFGCPYECTYCYLQEYSNSPGLLIPSNIDKYLASIQNKTGAPIRIGTGEFTDSLALDQIINFSEKILGYARNNSNILFEFKTKSTNIENIIKCEPSANFSISWSLNPSGFIKENEYMTASLDERIKAASLCIKKGYKVGFHFDPIVIYEGWEDDYKDLVSRLLTDIAPDKINWISLGTFRFTRKLKKIIENRYPENSILDGELVIGFDGKLRYTDIERMEIYKKMVAWIRKFNNKILIYLCMEKKDIWKKAGLPIRFNWG